MNIIIIGGGPAGYQAAIRASQFNNKVTLIESDKLGGTCLNVGCIPTKTLLSYADELYKLKKPRPGINLNYTIDEELIYEEKQIVINKLRKGIEQILKSYKVDLILGEASFINPSQIKVNDTVLSFDKLILATGSTALVPKNLFVEGFTITSTEVLNTYQSAKNIVIIGGGIIGCELAFMLNSFGKEITIIEKEASILLNQDKDAVRLVELSMKKKGIKLIKGQGVKTIEDKKISLENGEIINTEKCVLALGRIPNIKNLNLDLANINIGAKQEVLVDSEFKTSNTNVYAVGDVNNKIQLAHYASNTALFVVHKINNKEFHTRLDIVPKVSYTMPEIASVYSNNYKETDKANKMLYAGIGKALCLDINEGFCKVFTNDENLVTGAVFCGFDADNLINLFTFAIDKHISILSEIIYPHPSLAELVLETAEDVQNKAIHKLRR